MSSACSARAYIWRRCAVEIWQVSFRCAAVFPYAVSGFLVTVAVHCVLLLDLLFLIASFRLLSVDMSAPYQGKASGGFVSSLSGPIGLIAEYKEHRKQLKQSRSANNLNLAEEPAPAYAPPLPPRLSSPAPTADGAEFVQRKPTSRRGSSGSQEDEKGFLIEGDEGLWEVDEALDTDYNDDFSWEDGPTELPANDSMEKLVRGVMNFAPGSATNPNPGKKALPCPVIIPQRRPRKRQRGFLRAYAPALGECGIGQDEFLEFLKNFHKASKASPVFTVMFIASQGMINIPNHIMNPIGILINASATVGMEVQSRYRTNNFLDRMNQELFQPAGLYAMIVKYKTDDEIEKTMPAEQNLYNMISFGNVDLDTNQSIAKYKTSSAAPKTVTSRLQTLRVASGVTRGAVELPEACPLVFPDLDKQVQEAPETFREKFKDASKFLSGYLDRSAVRAKPSLLCLVDKFWRTYADGLMLTSTAAEICESGTHLRR